MEFEKELKPTKPMKPIIFEDQRKIMDSHIDEEHENKALQHPLTNAFVMVEQQTPTMATCAALGRRRRRPDRFTSSQTTSSPSRDSLLLKLLQQQNRKSWIIACIIGVSLFQVPMVVSQLNKPVVGECRLSNADMSWNCSDPLI